MQLLNLIKKPSFIAVFIFAVIPVYYSIDNLSNQSNFLLDFIDDTMYVWLPLAICFVVGFFAWRRYRKTNQKNDLVVALVPLLCLSLVGICLLARKKESQLPVLCIISNSDLVTRVSLDLRTEQVYTVVKSQILGNSWFEGKYKVVRDTIFLFGETGPIADTLVMKRNASHCPETVDYKYKGEASFRENELHVAFDSLFCK